MTDIRASLADLVARLSADGDLDDLDLALIHDAAVAEANARQQAKKATERAHIHDVPHRPVITVYNWGEDVDASGIVCHDCGRELVSDAGTTRVLVCPRIHGNRSPTMLPDDPDGAVECGGG